MAHVNSDSVIPAYQKSVLRGYKQPHSVKYRYFTTPYDNTVATESLRFFTDLHRYDVNMTKSKSKSISKPKLALKFMPAS